MRFGTENMRIVLDKAPHTHQALQGTGSLVAVAGTEFRQAQWQVAIAFQSLIEDLDMAGAVHRLYRVISRFGFHGKHVFPENIPVAGPLPKGSIHHLGRFDFPIAIATLHIAHVALNLGINTPTLRMPEHHPRGFFLHMEQVEFLGQLTVIALFRLFQPEQVGIQFFLARPGRAIDALQHFIIGVTPPVGPSHFHQLEVFELSR